MSEIILPEADELERLAWFAEECGEAIQAVGKILRHGYDNHNPDDPSAGDNRAQLTKEIEDILSAIYLLELRKDIREVVTRAPRGRYMHCKTNRLHCDD